ncbi:hypothetical protein [Salinisphaera sp. G21_0]|uniref:hypothetical protein n=1 Tax=Salinisphaera sp. G21_0 TaxID=2821094 RepID=UPI001ADADC03|nr:hypothetical protein [Salinisphaera sp. G21_0]MBO9481000.1 hypothetical protein [Salinisphaera sp. G21_0]
MSLKPFKLNKNAYLSDPDKCNDQLQDWVEQFLDIFYESPEYQKLSKANQKSGGMMFSLFMELNMNYLGKGLESIDLKSTREVMTKLFPRKMICSDTQAKTIVPEIIACWQCLQRLIDGSAQKKKLKHAEAIINYLQSIKKDYLKIYNHHDASGPTVTILESATPDKTSTQDDWIEALIEDAVTNLATIRKQPEPPQSWHRLYDLQSLSQFLFAVCIEGIDEDESDAVAALLSFALHSLFIQIRQGSHQATHFWQEVEQNIMLSYEHDELDSVAMTPLLGVLAGHRQYLSESFMEFIHHWQTETHDSQDSKSDFSLEDLNKICQAMLEEIPDEFTFASVWQDQMGFMPPEGISLIGQQILSLDNPRYGDFLSLLVLDEQEKSAVAIADLLANHPKAITPLTLERMIRIRNWLPKAVQTHIDKLIKNVRKLGVCPSGKKVSTDGEIQAWMTSVDGSGAQGVMIIVNDINHPRAFRLVNFVLKEAVGIVDISVSPPETRKKLQHIITSTKQHGVPFEKVTSELIRKLIPPFMALNLSSKTCLSADMLEGMELLGLDNWNPASAQFETLSPELLSFNTPPSDQEIASVQKRSVSWTNSAFADSWLISDAFTITGGTVKKMISDVCDQVLEPKKGVWRERMQRMCLWANACESKQRQKQARDFAVVSWLLEQDMPASQIKLLESIVKKSL